MSSHSYTPHGTSEASTSIDDLIRPSLRHAFPLPDDDMDSQFQRLLDALARRTGHAPQRTHADR